MSTSFLAQAPVLLENGERIDQKTFHAWYETTPKQFKAELIGGEIFVSSPTKASHGIYSAKVVSWLGFYEIHTPGTQAQDNTTIILDADNELQPDASLCLVSSLGGQSSINEEGYVIGAPEFVSETANSSGSIDLHRKKDEYERAGVKEYMVVLVRNQQVRWFSRMEDQFQETPPDPDGIYRSKVFPGLWLDPRALLRLDGKGLLETLQKGLAGEDHLKFVADLAARFK